MRRALGVGQGDNPCLFFKGRPRFVDADHTEGAAVEFDCLADPPLEILSSHLTEDDLFAPMEPLPFHDFKVLDGIPLRVVVFGRNVMQAQDPAKFIAALCEVVKKGPNPGETAACYGLD